MVGVAGALGLSAVALGAFGAHGLRDRLGPGMLEIYRTGALYHLVHAVAALAVALSADRLRRAPGSSSRSSRWAIVIFSGSLYALAITGIAQLGAVTPIGGLCLLVAWGLVGAEAFGRRG